MKAFDWSNPILRPHSAVRPQRGVHLAPALAAQAGLRMLLKGGNAVDAAIAAAAPSCWSSRFPAAWAATVSPSFWDGQQLHGLNSSGVAPAAWNVEYFKRKHGVGPNGLAVQPKRGWDSVTVPGVVAGWAALHESWASCRSSNCSSRPSRSPSAATPCRRWWRTSGRRRQ